MWPDRGSNCALLNTSRTAHTTDLTGPAILGTDVLCAHQKPMMDSFILVI